MGNHTEAKFYDLQQLKDSLAGRIDEFVITLFPNAKRENSCYKIGNLQGEKGTSLMISTRSTNPGWFIDYSDVSITGHAWRLVSLVKGISLKDGIAWVANFCNVPPIQSFGNVNHAKNPEELAAKIRTLSPKSLAYAASRGINEETLLKYGIGSDVRDGLVFPYYDAFDQLGMIKHWGHSLKADGKKDTWTSPDPVMSLFGKDVCDPETGLQRLVITEGEWDAMACWQLGIPAVSIPMGVSNMQWITEDYQFLSHFDEVVLLFDSDEPGKKAAKDVAARLGTERCLICRLPLKDANDMLKAGRGGEIKTIIETTTKEPIAEIVDPASMKEGVKSYMKGEHLVDGDPFFLPSFDISFRKHEVTLWFGFSFHGKSQAVQNQMAYLASRGKASCIASFEQPPELTLSQIITCATAYPNLPFTDEFDAAYDYMTRNVFMYKSMDRACPKHLVSTFIHAHKRYGIDTFVIDNVMTMSIDRGDNTAQAEAMDLLRMFVSKYPVHLHIVAHPRKPPEKTTNPPGMAEIRGASEWGDMPHNIITVWRDMAKAERIAEMENDGFSDGEMKDYYNSTPCGKLIVRKQRTTGETPMTSFFFHKPTKRFTSKAGEPNAMFSQKPW
jgi:twinkle protein